MVMHQCTELIKHGPGKTSYIFDRIWALAILSSQSLWCSQENFHHAWKINRQF